MLRLACVSMLLAPLLTACATEADEGVTVVATLYPLQYLAERVAGDSARVTLLAKPGQEPHDMQLTVAQTAELSDADVVVYAEGLQPAVDEVLGSEAPQREVEAIATADTGVEDPHVWMDPAAMVEIATALRDRLVEVDPGGEDGYDTRLEAVRGDLEALDEEYAAGLRDCAVDTVVVSHDAFGHLPTPFTFEAINGSSADAEPSPARLRELADLLVAEGVDTVFAEPLGTADLAETLAGQGVEVAVLDPIEGLSEDTEDEDYLSLMRADLAALRKANRCR